MNQKFTKESVREALETKLSRYFGVTLSEANEDQIYRAVMMCVKDILSQKRSEYKEEPRQSGPHGNLP